MTNLFKKQVLTLANERTDSVLVLTNESSFDDDGWALIAPFGEHLNSRHVRTSGGGVKQERFIQVNDEAAADAVLSNENSIFRKIKKALFGMTVYKGHPDLKDYEPTVIGNSNGKKVPLGVVDKLRKTSRGIEAHFNLLPESEHVVANEGHKFPSVVWRVRPFGERDGATLVNPYQLLSIGLTKYPNISGVDALANARADADAEQKTKNEKRMKNQLAGWLVGQGITLSNEADDLAVINAIQNRVTTLANERATLQGQVTTLTNERDDFKKKFESNTTALANAQEEVKTKHKALCAAVVDLAISQGKIVVAKRETEITTLANAADFTAAAAAIEALPRETKTTGQETGKNKVVANASLMSPRDMLLGKVQEKVKAGTPYAAAFQQAKTENPALVEAMRTAK